MGDITIIPIYDLSYLFKADSKEKWKLVSILKEL
jgi:DNA polymerase